LTATAGAKILEGRIPAVPQWGWALIVMVVLTATNLASVSYGEFEFWFAGIKVVAIAAFVGVGLLAVFGLLPGSDNPGAGFAHLTDAGGFMPNGAGAILTGVLMVAFSFMGSEIVTLAAGESENPQRAVTKATNSVIWRVGVDGEVFAALAPLAMGRSLNCAFGGGDRTQRLYDSGTLKRLAGITSQYDPANLFRRNYENQPRRPMSFQAVGSAPIARAAFRASPIRKGTRPAAIAALNDIPVVSARYGTPTA
jgi:hypothetical protein